MTDVIAPSKKFPVISLIVCLMAMIVLCGLGIWQLQRLVWKNNLQQQLDQVFSNQTVNPISEEQLTRLQEGQIARGRIDGSMDFSKAFLLNGRIQDGHSTMAVVAPLVTGQATGRSITLAVEVGCAEKPDLKRIQNLGPKGVMLLGIVRDPKWSFAAPSNIPEKNQWWRLDHKDMGAYWGVPHIEKAVITLENTKDLLPSLSACPVEKKLRNEHLSYAFFWFSLVGILAVIWSIRFLKPYLQSA